MEEHDLPEVSSLPLHVVEAAQRIRDAHGRRTAERAEIEALAERVRIARIRLQRIARTGGGSESDLAALDRDVADLEARSTRLQASAGGATPAILSATARTRLHEFVARARDIAREADPERRSRKAHAFGHALRASPPAADYSADPVPTFVLDLRAAP